ncbi:MAG: MBL fold metallo-hydrolase [Deltaproteobacteria bacterium]|nr:MBL fold metallo-hydrolase [Deltaproteobacteria bacterium]
MKITILGSGGSTGTPVIGCLCQVCRSENPKNKRTRASIFIETQGIHFLIDSSTDFRQQMLREKIERIDAVLYTHCHADHIHGIDDLRCFNTLQDNPIPIYADVSSLEKIQKYFDYIFCDCGQTGFIPRLIPYKLQEKMKIFGVGVTSIPLLHGPFSSTGFRIGNVAYLTDVKKIPDKSYKLLKNLDLLILGALRYTEHPSHMTFQEAIAELDKIKPARTLFTHMAHQVDHDQANLELPQGVELCYDGMAIGCN